VSKRKAQGNRGDSENNVWLTPKSHVDFLGPFELDPCCPPTMPWRTASTMVFFEDAVKALLATGVDAGRIGAPPQRGWEAEDVVGNGLEIDWKKYGRKFVNPPYDDPLPWVEKMADADNGIILLPGKSPDTKWGQLLLATADLVLFVRGRFPFWLEDGTESKGKWNPHVYAAYGEENAHRLVQFEREILPGILMESHGSRAVEELMAKYAAMAKEAA
jgi:hypothetical protein